MWIGSLSPAPNHVVLFCLLVFPVIDAPHILAAVGIYFGILSGFILSGFLAHRFIHAYHSRPWSVDLGLLVVGMATLIIHVRAPGPLEPLAFCIASIGYGCWFRAYWDDDLFEVLLEPDG
jgi:hypothetical protein